MRANHPETLLTPYLRDELAGAERDRVERHLSECARCRASADSYSSLLAAVARSGENLREPDWGVYDAQLRRKLTVRGVPQQPRWSRELVFGAFAAAAVAAVIAIVVLLPQRANRLATPGVDQLAMESEIGSADLGLMRDYPVIQHLDLLENYEVIENLDQVDPAHGHATPS
ncbi:MAG TPA: zf-HC2 domain-containing protein [Candidatus Binataceae bacterium]|nr:zf-HC2 domain-containing protein [Candidatus Binataceae bacterium]